MSIQNIANSENTDDDIRSVAKGAGTHLIGAMLGRVFIVVMLIFLSRVLSIEEFGLFSLGWSINRILIIISSGGLYI